MKEELLGLETALAKGKALPYALIRRMSSVTLGVCPEEVDTADLLEASFFSADKEIRVFRDGGSLRAVSITEEPDDVVIEDSYLIENPEFGSSIAVHKHVCFDEDGQAAIKTIRPVGWRGGRENG